MSLPQSRNNGDGTTIISSVSCVCHKGEGVGAQGEMGAGGGVTVHNGEMVGVGVLGKVPFWNWLN